MYIEFKPGAKYPPHDADTSDNLETFKDAGYILQDNELVIDIDCLNREQITALIETFNIRTHTVWTDRGVHFYFKKPETFTKGSVKTCSLGFEIELKHSKNTTAVYVKKDGKVRDIDNPGIREDLPKIFSLNKKFDTLLGMDEGEGRNTSLFTHRTKLANVQGWEKMLRFINDYIFADSLGEDEFDAVTRDITITAEKDNEPLIAEWFMNTHKAVKYLGSVFFLYKGRYMDDEEVLKRIIFQKVGDQKTRYIDEVVKQIDYRCKLIDNNKEFDIKFKNGILRDGQFIPIQSEDFTPYRIDVEYKVDAKPVKVVDDYIATLTAHEKEYKDLIFEVLGHTLITNIDFKKMLAKFFIFIGGGGNGKGTLLEVINKILNPENCTALSIRNLCDERYNVTLRGKLANLGDDIQNEPINDEQMKVLKNISTCDSISVRQLYKQSQEVRLTTSLIFTSNHVLKSFEKGESYKRRVSWLPMYTVVKDKDKRADFMKTLTTGPALEYWVRRMVEGYFRLYENGNFTKSPKVDLFNRQYHEDNNTSLAYLDDYTVEDLVGKRLPDVFEDYENWATENGLNVGSMKMLKEALEDTFGLAMGVKKIAGRSTRVLIEMEKTEQFG